MIKKILISSVLLLGLTTSMDKGIYHNPINEELLYRIGRVESNHNDNAVSKKGAIGRYQIRYVVWHKELKKEGIIKNRKDLFKHENNKKAAYYVLGKYYSQTGDLRKTLVKYSGGAKKYSCKVLGEIDCKD